MGEGFDQTMLYPVEGDSAIVEVSFDGEEWAHVTLDQLDVRAEGEARVANVRVVVRLFPPYGDEKKWWEFDLDEVEAQLRRARESLLENERGRIPIAEDTDLTRAGAAFTKICAEDQKLWQPDDVAESLRASEAAALRESATSRSTNPSWRSRLGGLRARLWPH